MFSRIVLDIQFSFTFIILCKAQGIIEGWKQLNCDFWIIDNSINEGKTKGEVNSEKPSRITDNNECLN